jgi:hypothetical protein
MLKLSPQLKIILSAYQELAKKLDEGLADFGYEDMKTTFKVGDFKINGEGVTLNMTAKIEVPVNLLVDETQSSETANSKE